METKIKCPWCEQEYTVDSSLVGQTVKCEICEKEFTARKIAVVSPPPNSLPDHFFFRAQGTGGNKLPPHSSRRQISSVSSNPIENLPSEYDSSKGAWKWIADFFDFKIMVTPSLIKILFHLLFLSGIGAITTFPFKYYGKSINVHNSGDILLFIFGYIVWVILGIPLLAVILHYLFELTMIPFSILNVLTEIRNKLGEKAKS